MLLVSSRTDCIDRLADALVLVDRADYAGGHVRVEHRLLVDAVALVPERHLSEQVVLSVHVVVKKVIVVAEHSTRPEDDRLGELFTHCLLAVVLGSQPFGTISDDVADRCRIDVQRGNVDEPRDVVSFGDLCDQSGSIDIHFLEREVAVGAKERQRLETSLRTNGKVRLEDLNAYTVSFHLLIKLITTFEYLVAW